MRRSVKGIQLPGGTTTGPITGGFTIADPEGVIDDTTGQTRQIIIPTTAIVNAMGEEIGNEILKELRRIGDLLEERAENG
jgi:hypothetical protein